MVLLLFDKMFEQSPVFMLRRKPSRLVSSRKKDVLWFVDPYVLRRIIRICSIFDSKPSK